MKLSRKIPTANSVSMKTPAMKTTRTRTSARILAGSIAALLAAQSASATTIVWDGGGADANLLTAINWSTDIAPVANDSLVFDGATRLAPSNNFTAGTVFNGLTFNAGAGAFTLSGNQIGLNGTITDNSLSLETISAAIALSATETVNVSLIGGSLTLSGVISGTTFGLTKTGSGLLTLSGANTFTGPVSITGGTLSIAADGTSAANPLGSGASAVNLTIDGGALRITAGSVQIATNRSILLGNSGAGTGGSIDNALLASYNGVMANNGGTNSFTKTGAGELRLGGVSTYTGSTFVNQGTLKLDFTAFVGTTTNIINSGSTLVLGGAITGLNNTQLKVVGLQPGAALNVTSKNSGNSSQTFNGLTLNQGNNTITATQTVGGNMRLALGAITHTSGGNITFTLPSVTPTLTNAITTTNANTNGILGGWARTSTGDWAANDGSGNIVSYTAYTTLAGATPTLVSGATTNVKITSGSTGNINFAAGTTDVNTILSTDAAARMLNVLSGDTLRLGAFGAIVDSDTTANVVFTVGAAGSFLTAGGAANTAGELVLTGNSSTLNSGNGITVASSIVNNGTGAVTVVSNGNARTILLAANTYTGGTYINSGEVRIDNLVGFGSGDVRIQSGGQAYINVAGTVTNNFFISGDSGEGSSVQPLGSIRIAQASATLSGTITLTSDARIAANNGSIAAPNIISGKITGNFNLDIANANGTSLAVISLSNTSNDFSGNLSLNGYVAGTAFVNITRTATLTLGANNVLPDGVGKGNVIINGASVANAFVTLDLNGKSETINGLVSGGTLTNAIVTNSVTGASVLTVGGGDATATFAGKIQDGAAGKTLAITKTGLGTQTLSGVNTYIGGTTVNAGTLLWSGANNLPTTGTLQVNAGGNFSLADGTALTTTTTAALNLANGANLTFDWAAGALDKLTSTAAATTTGNVGITIKNAAPTEAGGTLISSASGGLTTANGTLYFLSNNTNFAAALSVTDTAVSIGLQAVVTALTDAYWLGNQVTGATGAMALSSGTTSNWASDAAGTAAGGVVPGGGIANVIFGATGASQQASVTTGADMNLGSITFNDSAAVTLAGSNALTLNNTSATAASTSGALATVTAGSAISVTSFANATNTISAKVALGAGQTWNVASGKTLTVSGAVSGTNSLTKADSGTVTLSGANTYTGATIVSGGKLIVSSTGTINLTSGVTIGAAEFNYNSATTLTQPVSFSTTGGTLSGTGTIGTAVTVTSGNNLSPGNSPGTLSFGAGLTLAAGGIFNWENNTINTLGTVGTDWDRASVTGTTLIDSTATTGSKLKLLFTDAGTSFANSFWNNDQTFSSFVTGGISAGNLFDGTNLTVFINAVQQGATNTIAGLGTFTTAVNGANLDLKWTHIGNNSQILITSAPDSSSIVTGASAKAIALGRVVSGGTQVTGSQTIANSGTDSAAYTVTLGGDVSASGLTAGTLTGLSNTSGTITLDTETTGSKSGTVTVANTSADSHAAGLGSAEGSDVFTVTGTAVANRTLTATALGALGLQHVGATYAGPATTTVSTLASTAGDDDRATRVTLGGGTDGSLTVAGSATVFNTASHSEGRGVSGSYAAAGVISGSFNLTTAVDGSETVTGTTPQTTAVTYSASVFNGTGKWTSGTSGDWGTHANWTDSNTINAAPGTFASFDNVDTATLDGTGAGPVISLNGTSPSVKNVAFSGATAYTVAPGSGGTLKLKADAGSATVSSSSTVTQTLSTLVELDSNTVVSVTNIAGLVSTTGNISQSGSHSLTKVGTGTLDLNGANQAYTTLNVNDGTANVNGTLGATPGTAAVSVTDTAGGVATKLRFGSVSQTLSSLTIGAGATVIFTSGAASGTFTGGGGGGGGAVVPEPGTLGLLLVGALGMLNRRRRQAWQPVEIRTELGSMASLRAPCPQRAPAPR